MLLVWLVCQNATGMAGMVYQNVTCKAGMVYLNVANMADIVYQCYQYGWYGVFKMLLVWLVC